MEIEQLRARFATPEPDEERLECLFVGERLRAVRHAVSWALLIGVTVYLLCNVLIRLV